MKVSRLDGFISVFQQIYYQVFPIIIKEIKRKKENPKLLRCSLHHHGTKTQTIPMTQVSTDPKIINQLLVNKTWNYSSIDIFNLDLKLGSMDNVRKLKSAVQFINYQKGRNH